MRIEQPRDRPGQRALSARRAQHARAPRRRHQRHRQARRPTRASSAGARAAAAPTRARSRRRSRPMAPFVVGRDPWDTEAIARDVFRTGLWDYRATTGNFAFAGIDMALWDLCGKACGQPLHRLFGGPMRRERRLLLLPRPGTPEEVAAQVRGRRRARLRRLLPQGRPRRARRGGDAGRALRDAIGPDAQDPHRRQRGLVGPRGRPAADPLARSLRHRLRRGARADLPARPHADLRARTPVALCANEGLGSRPTRCG